MATRKRKSETYLKSATSHGLATKNLNRLYLARDEIEDASEVQVVLRTKFGTALSVSVEKSRVIPLLNVEIAKARVAVDDAEADLKGELD